MAIITAIEKQKRRQRADLYLDGVYAFSLRLDLITTAKLETGREISSAERHDLEAEEQRLGAMESALRLLAVQPRSEKDLRDRLRQRGFRSVAIDIAIGRMQEMGYLNDEAFARFWVEARQAATPRSRRALAFELSRKGVDCELATESVSELSDEDAALDAAQRRLRSLRGLDRQTFTRKLGAFLASRGFGYGVSRSAIDRCWQSIQEEQESPASRSSL